MEVEFPAFAAGFRVALVTGNPNVSSMAANTLNHSTILIVEDEPLLRRRLAAQLEKVGAEVTAVASLAEARQALRGLEFDFTVLDLHLPDGQSLVLLDDKSIPESAVTVIMTAEG